MAKCGVRIPTLADLVSMSSCVCVHTQDSGAALSLALSIVQGSRARLSNHEGVRVAAPLRAWEGRDAKRRKERAELSVEDASREVRGVSGRGETDGHADAVVGAHVCDCVCVSVCVSTGKSEPGSEAERLRALQLACTCRLRK